MFKHEVRDETTKTERSESWHAEIGKYDVGVHRRADGLTEVWISPYERGMRLPLLSFHPKRVDDLEAVINVLPELLRAVIAEMRTAGLDDLRSRFDKMHEEYEREREQWMAEFMAKREAQK